MNKHALFILSAFICFSWGCKKSGSVTKPVRRDLTQAVYASGKIYPLYDYKVFSKLPGYIEKIHVHVGDTVKTGQRLMTIKSEVSALNVNTAKNLLELARENGSENSPLLSALRQDVASAKARYQLDSLEYSRYENLIKANAVTRTSHDQAKTQADISHENYLKAQNNYQSTRDRVRVELENAQIQYDAQISNKNDYTITAAVNGKVYDIIPKEGELVNTQVILMEIGDGSHYEIELSVDETDVSLVHRGQSVMLSMDAYGDKVFQGKITEAYPRINQANKTSKVMASIDLQGETQIYSGMSVEANIIIAERKNTLVIPREFLVDGKKVMLKSNGELVPVHKGAEDLEFVEVLDGIDEKTELKKP
ncbi:MAG TPA: efflux RND transporter periplasmic adaptor subunit [Bacteroidia bacterium]|jgi:multidrug efflux pump subunit AcrA (membrane-fusion protein)|nr:efflux RND transporter periplasmic adaptor subunit [Bacteroidia bacterium]